MPQPENINRPLTPAYAAVQAAFWMSFCVFIGYAAVYLQALGYSNAALGAILAAGNLLGALLGPALCARIDRDERVTAAKLSPPVLTAQAAAIAGLLLFPVRGAATTVFFLLYIAFGTSVNSLNLKLLDDAERGGARVDYAFARGFGSLAYVLVSVLLGVLVKRVSVRVLPFAALALCAFQFCAFWTLKRQIPVSDAPGGTQAGGGSMAAFLRKNPRFCVLLLGTAILFFSHNMVTNFLINVTRNVGGDESTMGALNGFMALTELPVMLFYSRLFARRKPGAMLRLSFVFFTLKSAAVAAARSVPALSAAFLLQAPSFALYTVAVVPYVSRAAAREDLAKAQSLAFTMTTVGSMLASVIAGRLYDALTVTATLWIGCALGALGTAIAFFGVAPEETDAA